MKYRKIKEAVFLERPNRFIADVLIGDAPRDREPSDELACDKLASGDFSGHVSIDDGKEDKDNRERVHVKNTGRCKELLIPGCRVWLEESDNPERKTKYDLVAVEKQGLGIVNIDSQAPNKVMKEWLEGQGYDLVRPEYTWGNSRFDFYLESRGGGDSSELKRTLVEVKGCTLEVDGIGYFPDAPTERGVKHIRELIKACGEGFEAVLAFVIQMEGITEVRPNISTHPEFGQTLEEAKKAGVKIWFMLCGVEPEGLFINEMREG